MPRQWSARDAGDEGPDDAQDLVLHFHRADRRQGLVFHESNGFDDAIELRARQFADASSRDHSNYDLRAVGGTLSQERLDSLSLSQGLQFLRCARGWPWSQGSFVEIVVQKLQHFAHVNGLRQIRSRTGGTQTPCLRRSRVCTEHCYGNRSRPRAFPEPPQHFFAVHIGEMQVEQDQVGAVGTGEVEACLALSHPHQADAGTAGKETLHQPPVRHIVLDIQDRARDSGVLTRRMGVQQPETRQSRRRDVRKCAHRSPGDSVTHTRTQSRSLKIAVIISVSWDSRPVRAKRAVGVLSGRSNFRLGTLTTTRLLRATITFLTRFRWMFGNVRRNAPILMNVPFV